MRWFTNNHQILGLSDKKKIWYLYISKQGRLNRKMKLLSLQYIDFYKKKQPITLLKHFNKLRALPLTIEGFKFYFANSAVYSSMIEGNIIDFDTYLKFSSSNINTGSKSFKEIEDLIAGYQFAKVNTLNLKNFLNVHKILSKTILGEDKKHQGKIRKVDVFIFNRGVKIYTGADKSIVKEQMEMFFEDIDFLLNSKLSIDEVFYFASFIHLRLAQIHPFGDGNGRSARLLEKWFLATKLGENAWFIQSERLYQKRLDSYYKNINLGDSYDKLDYDFCIPFLLELPMALRLS